MTSRVLRSGLVVLVGTACLALAAVGCGGGDEGADPDTSSGTSAEPTSTTGGTERTTTSTTEAPTTPTSHAPDTVEGQVEAAYLESWQTYVAALEAADADLLEAAFAGEALQYKQNDVQYLVDNDLIARGRVEHDYIVQLISETRAVVNDHWVNHLYDVDPVTNEPTQADPDQQMGSSFLLELTEGRWFVVDINAL